MKRLILIDPSSPAYYEDRLFSDECLNRDYCLQPMRDLKKQAVTQNIAMHTADLYFSGKVDADVIHYYSLGVLRDYAQLQKDPKLKLEAFFVFEPPVVEPRLYKALSMLTHYFPKVYVHNADGDGYDLAGVDQSKLEKIYWPQPFAHVLDGWQHSDRLQRIVVVNGHHRPLLKKRELYGERIRAMAALNQIGIIDLYGRGWDRWFSRTSLWWPYWRHFSTLRKIYRGPCESKYAVLSQYQFALCFENYVMKGYITEKLFDCLYAGTIPIYLGAPDITQFVPEGCFIDMRQYNSYADLWRSISELSDNQLDKMKQAGRQFIGSERYNHDYVRGLQQLILSS